MKRWLDKAWPRALAQRSALALALATLLSRSLTAAGGSPVSHGVGLVPHDSFLRVPPDPVIAWPGLGVGLLLYVRYFMR
jgi:hypothetical protein